MYRVEGVNGLNVFTGIMQSITYPKSATWRAKPSILHPDGWSVIGSAGYAVRIPIGSNGARNIANEKPDAIGFCRKNAGRGAAFRPLRPRRVAVWINRSLAGARSGSGVNAAPR